MCTHVCTCMRACVHVCVCVCVYVCVCAQGVYNCLLLVLIVGGTCFLRHQLAAVFNASLSVF